MPTENRRSTPDTTEEVSTAAASPATWWLTAGTLVLVGAVVAAAVFFFTGDDTVTPDTGRVAELEASAGERDVAQVEELVQQTRTAHEELLPVVESLDGAVPANGSASPDGEEPGADEVDDWLATTDGAAEHFEDVPSGETDYNVAHAGLANSVDLLGSAVVAYSSALEAEDEGLRAEMTELAGDLRTQAVRSWSVAATQLDVLSLDAGHGHVHLYLPAAPGSGALEPDPAEDGDGAAEDGGHDH